MNQLYLIRHGQSQANFERLMSGSVSFDCPLTDQGLAQAEALGQKLAQVPFHYVITSRLQRAKHTAEAILWYNRFRPEFRVENAALDERSMGITEGLLRADVAQQYGHAYDAWDSTLHSAAPGGETIFQVNTRVVSFFKEHIEPLLETNNVLIVSHCQVMRSIVGYIEGVPLEKQIDLHFKNCVPYQYDYS